jgi:hypothetical protein
VNIEDSSESPIQRAMGLFRRVLRYQVSIGVLVELAVWLAIPYLCIGFVWTLFHTEQTGQLETRVESVSPVGAGVVAFGLVTALWPASIQIADACPST